MTRVNRSWMAVVAAALLLGTLVGVVWARPNDRPAAATTTRKVTLTGADFIPNNPTVDWWNSGYRIECSTGACLFTAPVVFPTQSSVTVERIRLHVDDLSDPEYAEAQLGRANPSAGTVSVLGVAQSPTGLTSGLQTYSSPAINKVVWPSQKAHIWLSIGAPAIYVYGVTVEYHVSSWPAEASGTIEYHGVRPQVSGLCCRRRAVAAPGPTGLLSPQWSPWRRFETFARVAHASATGPNPVPGLTSPHRAEYTGFVVRLAARPLPLTT